MEAGLQIGLTLEMGAASTVAVAAKNRVRVVVCILAWKDCVDG